MPPSITLQKLQRMSVISRNRTKVAFAEGQSNSAMEGSINEAIKKGFFQQIRFLIEQGVLVDERDPEQNRTPLMNCALIDHESWGVGIALLLLEKGASICKRDASGRNAMHYACLYGRKSLVQVYLKAFDFRLNAVDRYLNTCLHYAAGQGNVPITKLLADFMKRYNITCNRRNRDGDTALMLAWKQHHYECGEIIVKAGSEESISVEHSDIEKLTSASSRPGTANNRTTTRPRTAFGLLQQASRHLPAGQRLSISNYSRQQLSGTGRLNKENLDNDDSYFTESILTSKATVRFFRPASAKDMRNKPEYFNISPSEYFVHNERCRGYNGRSGSSLSLGLVGGANGEDFINGNWRETLGSYLNKYNYQFSHSYCKSAVPPPEPVETEVSEEDGTTLLDGTAGPLDEDPPVDVNTLKKPSTKKNSILASMGKMIPIVDVKKKLQRQDQKPAAVSRTHSSLNVPKPDIELESSSTESLSRPISSKGFKIKKGQGKVK